MAEKWIDKDFLLYDIEWKKKPNDYPERELPTRVIVLTKYNDDPEVDDATKEVGTEAYLSDLISNHYGCSNNGFKIMDVTLTGSDGQKVLIPTFSKSRYDAPVIMDR